MLTPWILAFPAVVHLLGDAAGTADLTDRLEVRGRSTQNVTPNPSLDVVNTTTAKLALTGHPWTLSLDYTAMILEADAELAPGPTVMQMGDVRVTWQDRRVTVGLVESGIYGEENSATNGQLPLSQPVTTPGMPTPPTMPTQQGVQLLAAPAIIRFGASHTVLSAADRLSRTQTLSLTLEYALQGGLDASSQTVMPFIQGPRAEVKLAQGLSQRTALELRASVQRSEAAPAPCSPLLPPELISDTTAPCAPVDQIEQATATVRYALAPHTDASAGAGLAAVQVRLQDSQSSFDSVFFPVASASVSHSELVGRTSTGLALNLAVAPFLDFRSGVVDERAQATGTLQYPTHAMVYSGSLGATRSLTSTFVEPMTSFQVSFDAEYIESTTIGFGGGARYIWQSQDVAGTFSLAMIYAEITWRAPHVEF